MGATVFGHPWPHLAPDGAAGSPQYAFAVTPTSGLFSVSGSVSQSVSGTERVRLSASDLATGGVTISMGATVTAPDVILVRDAAAILAQRNTTNPQTIRVYGTFTDAANHERFEIVTQAGATLLRNQAAGTGLARGMIIATGAGTTLTFQTNFTDRLYLGSTGHFLPASNGSYDSGSSSLTWRDVYINNSVRLGTTPSTTGHVRLPSAGSVYARNVANSADILLLQLDGTNDVVVGQTTAAQIRIDNAITRIGASSALARLRFSGFYAASPSDPPASETDCIVVDTGAAQFFRVRYNDAGTMKVGDLALV